MGFIRKDFYKYAWLTDPRNDDNEREMSIKSKEKVMWSPTIGEKVYIKVITAMWVDYSYSNVYGTGVDVETLEERYFAGFINGLKLVSINSEIITGTVLYAVGEVFEIPKKEYTMEEIADSLGIPVKDLRIKE